MALVWHSDKEIPNTYAATSHKLVIATVWEHHRREGSWYADGDICLDHYLGVALFQSLHEAREAVEKAWTEFLTDSGLQEAEHVT